METTAKVSALGQSLIALASGTPDREWVNVGDLAARLGVTPDVCRYAVRGLRRRKLWPWPAGRATDAVYLRRVREGVGRGEPTDSIARAVGKTTSAVRKTIRRHGLARPEPPAPIAPPAPEMPARGPGRPPGDAPPDPTADARDAARRYLDARSAVLTASSPAGFAWAETRRRGAEIELIRLLNRKAMPVAVVEKGHLFGLDAAGELWVRPHRRHAAKVAERGPRVYRSMPHGGIR